MNKILLHFCFIILLTASFSARAEVPNYFEGDDNPWAAAIKAKGIAWSAAFKKKADSDKSMLDAMSAMEDIRTQQKLMAEDTVINEPVDLGNDLVTKAAEASHWDAANNQSEQFTNYLDDVITTRLSSEDTVDESIGKSFDKVILVSYDDEYKNADISSSMINSGSIFTPRTYGGEVYKDTGIESQLLRALDFIKLAVNPYNKTPGTSSDLLTKEGAYGKKMLERTSQSRRSLAYNAMNYIISMRTNVKNGGLGLYIKNHLRKLEEDTGITYFSEGIDDINDDISRYEFMDDLFTNIYMNPAWYISLDNLNPVSLVRKKAELIAFINMLNWENSKMLERIASLSATSLAAKVDN